MEALQTYEHEGMVLRLTAQERQALPEGPSRGRRSDVRAPGAGDFELCGLEVKQDGEGLMLTARVGGRNLARLYTEILLRDESQERFYGPVAREHIRADRDKDTGGVIRPDWEDPVDVRVRVRPSLRLLTDGVDWAFCFAVPEGYGSPDQRLNGLYTLAGGANSVRSLLVFAGDGTLKRAVAYAEEGRVSGPRTLAPKPGDLFAPFARVFTPPALDGEWSVTTALADVLTFGKEPLRRVSQAPLPGDYLVGVLAEDLDGVITRKYVPLRL